MRLRFSNRHIPPALLYVLILIPASSCAQPERDPSGSGGRSGGTIYGDLLLGQQEDVWRNHLSALIDEGVVRREKGTYRYRIQPERGEYLDMDLRLNAPDDVIYPWDDTQGGPLRSYALSCPEASVITADGHETKLTLCTRSEVLWLRSVFRSTYGTPDRADRGVPVNALVSETPDTLSVYEWRVPRGTLTLRMRTQQVSGARRTGVADQTDARSLYDVQARFEADDYDRMAREEIEEVRKSLLAGDLLEVQTRGVRFESVTPTASNRWSDRRVTVGIGGINRRGLEEPRGVTGFTFDVVIEKVSGAELCRIERRSINLPYPIFGHHEGMVSIQGIGCYDDDGFSKSCNSISMYYESTTRFGQLCDIASYRVEDLDVDIQLIQVDFEDGSFVGTYPEDCTP